MASFVRGGTSQRHAVDLLAPRRLQRRPWPTKPADGCPGHRAKPVAAAFDRLEAWCARNAGHVIAIGDAFTAVYQRWRVDPAKVSVIPNWAPLEEIVPADRDNPQATSIFAGTNGADLRLLYAGTLGRKHNPGLLIDLLVGSA